MTLHKEYGLPVKHKTANLHHEYGCGGSRVYLVGTQDGAFPDIGFHVKGEMGGLWNHPIKLLDGFCIDVALEGQEGARNGHRSQRLEKADLFSSGPFWTSHVYEGVLGCVRVTRTEFVPDDEEGIVVKLGFYPTESLQAAGSLQVAESLQAAESLRVAGSLQARHVLVTFSLQTDLRPVWEGDKAGMRDGRDIAWSLPSHQAVIAKDELNPWYVAATVDRPLVSCSVGHDARGVPAAHGLGTGMQLTSFVPLEPGHETSIYLFVSGSASSEGSALETLERLKVKHTQMFKQRVDRAAAMLSVSKLRVPDEAINEGFVWIRFATDMLVREEPSLGRGLGAGLPDYPWWFGCDNGYALMGALATGQAELAKSTLRLLARVSESTNGRGRIPHEVVTSGWVANPGNTQETAQFIKAVHETWKWTGDDRFLDELYPVCMKGINWLFDEMDSDGDLLPEGYGIMEVAGLNTELIDTAVHSHDAAKAAADMADYRGDRVVAARLEEIASRLAKEINSRFWIESEGLYADLLAKPSQLLERIDRIKWQFKYDTTVSPRVKQHVDEIERKCRDAQSDDEIPWLFYQWVILEPIVSGIAPPDRAARQLGMMEGPEFTTEHGLRICALRQKYPMTISTGVMAMAEFAAGRAEKGVEYINKILSTSDLRFPAYPSECSPDSGCFVQAWTNYGIAYAVARGLLGISPHVPRRRLQVSPCVPLGWEYAEIADLPVGDRLVSVKVTGRGDGREVQVDVTPQASWYISTSGREPVGTLECGDGVR